MNLSDLLFVGALPREWVDLSLENLAGAKACFGRAGLVLQSAARLRTLQCAALHGKDYDLKPGDVGQV